MRIVNPVSDKPFYVGKCKHNQAPKHVELQGVPKQVTIDGKTKGTMFDSPKSTKYIYLKTGTEKKGNVEWLFIEDKSIFELDELVTTKVTRSPQGEPETEITIGLEEGQ